MIRIATHGTHIPHLPPCNDQLLGVAHCRTLPLASSLRRGTPPPPPPPPPRRSMRPCRRLSSALQTAPASFRAPESVNRPPINLAILEENLQKCRNQTQFFQIQAKMVVAGYLNDAYAASRLVGFAASSCFVELDCTSRLLGLIGSPNEFSWNAVMRACVRRGRPGKAVSLYMAMVERADPLPDCFTHPIVLQACALRGDEDEGKEVHAHVEKLGFSSDVYAVNTLINMYSVCGNMVSARQLFDGSPIVDSVSWNSLLAGYIRAGDSEEALEIFSRMPERNTIACNSMIALLARERRPRDARNLFEKMPQRDLVSWSAIISCFDQNEMHREALEMFALMRSEGVPVDEVVLVSVLSASASLVAAREGELVHGLATKTGIDSYLNLNNALINMYSSRFNVPAARRLFDSGLHLDQISANSMLSGYLKCRLVDDAREFFDSMPQKDAVSWSTMVSGYAQNNLFSETLALFQVMQLREFSPDEAALVSVLSACAHLVALKQGKWVHAYIRRRGVAINPILGTTLVDMYMKCGCVEEAVEVFNGVEEKGVSCWNAVIIGLATNGMATEALEKFSEMKKLGLAPNEVTFVGVLAACRYLGSVTEGRRFFRSMLEEHQIEPNLRHYGCLVDLLGRAGLLREAEELIERMPMAPDVATWGALLGACKKHGNLEMGQRVSRRLIELEPRHDGAHVLLSNLYASSGRWEDAVEVRARMREKKVTKIPGCSLVEAGGAVHEFFAGDGSHPRMRDIERVLDEVARRMRLEGLRPDTSEVHLDIDPEEKETSLHRHSEKLAMAFGLISIPPPAPVRVVKNLRICGDCHSAAKAISRIFQREIVVRDRHLHHHFKDGECSCGDYW